MSEDIPSHQVKLVSVISATHDVTSTPENTVLVMKIVADHYGVVAEEETVYIPGDPYGIGPQLATWAAENPTFPIGPYVPPPEAEVRSWLPSLTRFDLKRKLKAAGILEAKIVAAINAIDDDDVQELMRDTWQDVFYFRRTDPIIEVIAKHTNKTPKQMDAIWSS